MEKRRERTLEQARSMLAAGGFDALNLRDLAEHSGISVPTIYNLIGNKAEILKALVMGAFAQFEQELESKLPCPAAEMAALMMSTFAQMISENEGYYRATALATERVENDTGDNSDYGFKRGPLRQYAGKLCQDALDEGLLRGDIHTDVLVEQMIGNHQVAFRDWAHHVISLEDLRKQSLMGFYIALAADAKEAFRNRIVEDLKAL